MVLISPLERSRLCASLRLRQRHAPGRRGLSRVRTYGETR